MKIVDDEKFIDATFFVNANLAVLSFADPLANARPWAADKGLSVSVDVRLFFMSVLLILPDKSVFNKIKHMGQLWGKELYKIVYKFGKNTLYSTKINILYIYVQGGKPFFGFLPLEQEPGKHDVCGLFVI